MSLKIRLRRQGSTNNIVYRIVVADSRSPRDGKCVETIGWYHPKAKEPAPESHIEQDRLQHWLNCGAQLTPTVCALMMKVAPELMINFKKAKKTKRA